MKTWCLLIPPFWMSGALDAIHPGNADLLHVAAAVLAVGIPIGGLYATNKYLAPRFTNKLADLGTSSTAPLVQQKKVTNNSFSIGDWITTSGLERASFSIVNAVMARDRKLKLKIYPSIGTVFVIAFVILFNGTHSVRIMFDRLPNSNYHIFLLYITFFSVQNILSEICYSDEFKAAWIYTSAPIRKPGQILSGAWKAVMIKFGLPLFAIFAVFIAFIWGRVAWDDIFFAMCSNLFLFLAAAAMLDKRLPFSVEPNMRNQAGNFARTMVMMLILAAMGGIHFFLGKVPYALWIGGPLLLMGILVLAAGFKKYYLERYSNIRRERKSLLLETEFKHEQHKRKHCRDGVGDGYRQ